MITLERLAQAIGVPFRGDGSLTLKGVATLEHAEAGQLSFLANPRYRRFLADTQAGAVVLGEQDADECPAAVLIASDPYVAYARAAAHFDPQRPLTPGVHASAVVDPSATVDDSAEVGPQCVIEAGVRIGAGTRIGPGSVIGAGSRVGKDCLLHARVTLSRDIVVGDRVILHSGAVIGADGFGIALDEGRWRKVPQLGSVRIGDDCEIGANTTIDRGAIEDTVLEEDVRVDNLVQIGHNVVVGAHTAMAGCVAVAGSTRIGRYCLIGGGAGIVGHIEIADRVTVTARTLVTHSLRKPGEYSSGSPLQTQREWRRNAARIRRLDDLARRVASIEKDTKK